MLIDQQIITKSTTNYHSYVHEFPLRHPRPVLCYSYAYDLLKIEDRLESSLPSTLHVSIYSAPPSDFDVAFNLNHLTIQVDPDDDPEDSEENYVLICDDSTEIYCDLYDYLMPRLEKHATLYVILEPGDDP